MHLWSIAWADSLRKCGVQTNVNLLGDYSYGLYSYGQTNVNLLGDYSYGLYNYGQTNVNLLGDYSYGLYNYRQTNVNLLGDSSREQKIYGLILSLTDLQSVINTSHVPTLLYRP